MVLHILLTGRFTESIFAAATEAVQAAVKAPIELGTSLVISRQATHRHREASSPSGARV
jgi:hypothetical protein